MDEDEVLKKITRLLEKGCTMLATHHDCGAPLFRCQGEVVCPVCSFGANGVASEKVQLSSSAAPKETISNSENASMQQRSAKESVSNRLMPEDNELIRIKAHLCGSMLIRLEQLTEGLEEEQDLDKLKKQLDCIEGLLRVFRFLQS
jgi:UPF0148 protein